jgi:hypothetical protein
MAYEQEQHTNTKPQHRTISFRQVDDAPNRDANTKKWLTNRSNTRTPSLNIELYHFDKWTTPLIEMQELYNFKKFQTKIKLESQ